MEDGRYDEAVRRWTEVIEADPEDGEAWFHKGLSLLLLETGQFGPETIAALIVALGQGDD